MKLEMELTPGEMLALGYCTGSGSMQAEARGETEMKKHIDSLMQKIWESNAKLSAEGGPAA